MENTIRKAFASQKNAPNKKLADIIARVEKKYGIDSAELDDEALVQGHTGRISLHK